MILETYAEPDDERFHDDAPDELEFEARAAYLLGVDLGLLGDARHHRVVRTFVDRVRGRDGRLAGVFLTQAEAVGRWTEALLELRCAALLRGLRTGATGE